MDTINESNRNLGEEIKKKSKVDIKALPNCSNFCDSMREMIGPLMNSRNSLKITQDDESERANILGVPIKISGADTIKINENYYELTPEIYKALT